MLPRQFWLLAPWEQPPDKSVFIFRVLPGFPLVVTPSKAIRYSFPPFKLVTVQFLKHIPFLFIPEATLQRQTFHLQQNVSTFPP